MSDQYGTEFDRAVQRMVTEITGLTGSMVVLIEESKQGVARLGAATRESTQSLDRSFMRFEKDLRAFGTRAAALETALGEAVSAIERGRRRQEATLRKAVAMIVVGQAAAAALMCFFLAPGRQAAPVTASPIPAAPAAVVLPPEPAESAKARRQNQ